jgi:N-ethylmaleimide reductase
MSLFSPFQLGPLTLPNRIVMAPLTRRRAGQGKVPTALNALHYEQRASAGLIISESTEVDPHSGGEVPTRPGIFNQHQVAGWNKVTDRVHDAGGRIFLQLSHLGRASHPLLMSRGQLPIGPSAIAAEGSAYTIEGPKPFPVPRQLDSAEIAFLVDQFAHGAALARQAGFDGVEIQAANGYLIDTFLRDGSNKRDDAYGGTVVKRARFLLEVVEAVANVWGEERVGVHLSPLNTFNGMSDSDPAAHFVKIAKLLDNYGLSYLHVIEPAQSPKITPLIREAFRGPLILSSGYTQRLAEKAVHSRAGDLVAFGEAFIANPDLPHRFRTGAALNTPDRATFYSGGPKGYTDYPALQPV